MKEQIYFNNLSEICNLANIEISPMYRNEYQRIYANKKAYCIYRLGSGRYELTVYKTLKGRVSC